MVEETIHILLITEQVNTKAKWNEMEWNNTIKTVANNKKGEHGEKANINISLLLLLLLLLFLYFFRSICFFEMMISHSPFIWGCGCCRYCCRRRRRRRCECCTRNLIIIVIIAINPLFYSCHLDSLLCMHERKSREIAIQVMNCWRSHWFIYLRYSRLLKWRNASKEPAIHTFYLFFFVCLFAPGAPLFLILFVDF